MKILLIEDVDTLGYKGEIFDVSPGYGRNFLIPRGLAVPATVGQLKQAEQWREQAAARREQLRKEHAALVGRLNDTEITFLARAGDKGRLYGSITTADIAARIEEALGIELDRRKVVVEGKALRQTGAHTALVRLDADFQANVTINVVDEAAAQREADRAAAAKAEETAAAETEDAEDFFADDDEEEEVEFEEAEEI